MSESISSAVKSKYGSVAVSSLNNTVEGVKAIATAFGYSSEELAAIPAEANMGLSCGNPTATAHLKLGEVVVDLGSGGGLDVFLAARKVGPAGKAIGIDMTPEMVARAQKGAAEHGFSNVEFHLAPIDKMPLPDAVADVIISNCVINLAEDKRAVMREMFRVLKPGGRVAVSDIALKKPLPVELASNIAAHVGCIAGAISMEDYRNLLLDAGFKHVVVQDGGKDLNAYAKLENQSGCCSPTNEKIRDGAGLPAREESSCCGGTKTVGLAVKGSTCCAPKTDDSGKQLHEQLSDLLTRYDVNNFAASCYIYAVKPEQ